MANQKRLIGVLAAAICLLVVFYFVKMHPNNDNNDLSKSTVSDTETMGIIDMHQAMQAHPQYVKLNQLKKARNTLALEADKVRDIQLDTTVPDPNLLAIDDVLRQEKQQKMQQKIQEFNQILKQKQQGFEQQFAAAQQLDQQAIDDKYLPAIFNLKLKMETLQITNATQIEIQRQIDGLKGEYAQRRQANDQKFFQKIQVLMQEEKAQAEQKLAAYAADVDRELQAKAHQTADKVQARNHLAMVQQSNELKLGMQSSANIRGSLDDKDQEIAVLEAKIVQDISSKVAKIALKNKLTVVLTAVQVNVRAIDITDLVIDEFKN